MTIKLIYIIFTGVLLAIFVGVGIDAFYPTPEYPEMPMLLKLYNLPVDPICDPDISGQLENAQQTFDADNKIFEEKTSIYSGNVSIISLIAAIIILIISRV